MLRSLAARATRSPPAPAAAATIRRLLHGPGGGAEAESVSYKMSMLRPPPHRRRRPVHSNSCSFIGRLTAPVQPFADSCDESPTAYSFLDVSAASPPGKTSSSSSSSSSATTSSARSSSSSHFRIVLHFKGKLAKVTMAHLKQNDLVYVFGGLGSYEEVDGRGKCYIVYKVWVYDLSYVLDKNQEPRKYEGSADKESTVSASAPDSADKYADRLRLWQIFFSSPYEWRDNRQSKRHLKSPDFTHKDTREALWISRKDPPWVRRQLELYDKNMAENKQKLDGRFSETHQWKDQDFN